MSTSSPLSSLFRSLSSTSTITFPPPVAASIIWGSFVWLFGSVFVFTIEYMSESCRCVIFPLLSSSSRFASIFVSSSIFSKFRELEKIRISLAHFQKHYESHTFSYLHFQSRFGTFLQKEHNFVLYFVVWLTLSIAFLNERSD